MNGLLPLNSALGGDKGWGTGFTRLGQIFYAVGTRDTYQRSSGEEPKAAGEVQETPPISRVLGTLQDFDRQLASSTRRQKNSTLICCMRNEITTLPRSCKEITTSPHCLLVNDERELQRGRSWLCGGNAHSLTLLRLFCRSASQKAHRDGGL
ncbi:hypothetical protein DFH08DRAFT_801280 [Mycena albidolilacea]|uniref:Uncharacterized protein n=1 Tax=Mycena albidolilacea TaxID=1033008 RepID=A0AAD7AIB0_9AGAR|nr:hypothetical protein DFH08DRAFT_801280 [Mycena albidolilacea]